MPLSEESQQYYLFRGPDGVQYVFRKLPQGSNLSPKEFCEWASVLFQSEIFYSIISMYVDDLLIASKGDDFEHLKDLEKVFARFLEYDAKLGIKKCKFFVENFELLGFSVSSQGISPLANKLD